MLGVCLKYEQNNYGSKLQALATVKMFEHLGIDYKIIHYNKKTFSFYLKSIPRLFNSVFINDRYCQIQRKIQFKKHPLVLESVECRNKAFAEFDKIFESKLSRYYDSYKDLKQSCKNDYAKVVTCSDQLWSPSALGSGFYNLMFVPDDIPKISWASSFGVTDIPWYQVKRTKQYLNRIENISMRENRGSEIVKELIGRDVPVLMDPVFVFNKEEWNNLLPVSPSEWGEYIFCYFLGSNSKHREAAKELSRKTGLKIVTLRHLDEFVAGDESFGDIAPYDVDPVRFLNILRNANYVCTDSFHGTAFSAIFEKQFLVFDRYSNESNISKNSRIESVCENLGLSERRYNGDKDVLEQMNEIIDYEKVVGKITTFSDKTKKYLNVLV